MEKSDKTKNAIGTISHEEYGFDGICAADCSDGHIIFNLAFCRSPFDHIEELVPIAKIRTKTTVKRGGRLGSLNEWMIRAIDDKGHLLCENDTIGWVIQHAKIHSKHKSSKCKFVKGSLSVLEKLAENDDFCRWNLFGKRFVDASSYYNEKEIHFHETIVVYFKRTESRYNRHKDQFAKDCLKLGLDFNKYVATNVNYVNDEEILREICNDLGYNLLTII